MSEIIGLKHQIVELSPYNPKWKKIFISEKKRLLKSIGKNILSFEHIGSTSIENICSKPIIDICAGLKNFEAGLKCVKPLEKAGYQYMGEFGIKGRHFFRTKGDFVKFHIHMYEIESENYRNHLMFRDYLIGDSKSACEYEKLKNKLKSKYKNNRKKYTEGKNRFISKIIKKAGKAIT